MTLSEFSHEFEVEVDSYRRIRKFDDMAASDTLEFNEYEKSIFLTDAQQMLMLEYYTGKNSYGDSFEKTEEVRRYLSNLNKTFQTNETVSGYVGVSPESVFFKLPDDLWFITYESVTFSDESLGCYNGKTVRVVPVTQDIYAMTKDNPFRGPNKRRVLRLDKEEHVSELVSAYKIGSYYVMYLSKPEPIVLIDLPEGLTIDGVSSKNECKLNSSLHRAILKRAVVLAIASKTAGAKQVQNNE